MARMYDAEIHFSDPVFTELRGSEVYAMWHMLCEQGSDLSVTLDSVAASGDGDVRARWEARYTFGPERRAVHNKIEASFTFADGKVIRHNDRFDLWRWTRMALGPVGILTGWTGFTQSKVRATARRSLTRFIDAHPDYR